MLSLWVEGVHWSQLELASPPSAVAGSKNAAYISLSEDPFSLLFGWAEVENKQQEEIKTVFFYKQMAKILCA